MNLKPLLKYFPELAPLDPDSQLAILQCAYDRCYGPANRLRIWRNNLLGGGLLTGISLLMILVIGPALHMTAGVTALVIMLVVLPGFFFWQQRNHINSLRPAVAACLAEHQVRLGQ